MKLLDTHAWIWWVAAPGKLSAAARRAIDREEVVGISAISCWELAHLVFANRLRLDREPLEWMRQALDQPKAELLDLTPEISVSAAGIGGDVLRDPVDRILVATALIHGAPIVTKDDRIRGFPGIRTIW